jgi:hypothetical protein
VRLGRHLDHGLADLELRAWREVLVADVEVEVELVTGEAPTVGVPGGGEKRGARVHDVQLHLGVGTAVRGPLAGPVLPGVAHEPLDEVEVALLEHLALADSRAAHDELEGALLGGRGADVIEPGLELGTCVVGRHDARMPSRQRHGRARSCHLRNTCARNWC